MTLNGEMQNKEVELILETHRKTRHCVFAKCSRGEVVESGALWWTGRRLSSEICQRRVIFFRGIERAK